MPGFRVPRHVIADFELICHDPSPATVYLTVQNSKLRLLVYADTAECRPRMVLLNGTIICAVPYVLSGFFC